MWKSILYTFIAFILYFLSITILGLLLSSNIVADFFLNIDESYWLFLNLFVYLLLIAITIIYTKVYGIVKLPTINRKITIQSIIHVVIIVILFRIMEDPILRMNIILKDSIPVINTNKVTPLLELVSTIMGIALLAPIFEELLFRRVMLNFYDTKYIIVGIVLSSLFFAFIHFNLSYTNYESVFSKFIFGVIACFVYIKKGLFHSILLHISYNTLWLIINENERQYWNVLQKLDFGVWYWVIVVLSFGLILYIGMINLKLFMKLPAHRSQN